MIVGLETATSMGRCTGGHEVPGVDPHSVQWPFADVKVGGAKKFTIIAKR